jgi:predicted peptidase
MSVLLAGCATHDPHTLSEQLLRISYESAVDNTERDFLVYLPRDYGRHADKKWPVLMFLHGNGERGNGKSELDFVMKHGPLQEAWIQRKDLPFIIIAPQLHMFGMDALGVAGLDERNPDTFPRRLEQGVPEREAYYATPDPMRGAQPPATFDLDPLPLNGWDKVEPDLLHMLDHVIANYRTDTRRLYLSGLSYGGYGTWYMASEHPTTFAAISPVVGWGHPDRMVPIAEHKIPVWAFAGGRDVTVESRFFFAGLNRLEELGHTGVRFTIHEDMGHDAWKRIYAGDDIYNWLLSHSLDPIAGD